MLELRAAGEHVDVDVVRENAYLVLQELREITRNGVCLAVAKLIMDRLGRASLDELTVRVAHAAGLLPYLHKGQQKDFFAEQLDKVSSIVAGMAAGADSIDDLHILRHGAMPDLFTGIRAPSTLGTFLRSFTHDHALQLHAVHRSFLGRLTAHTPPPGR